MGRAFLGLAIVLRLPSRRNNEVTRWILTADPQRVVRLRILCGTPVPLIKERRLFHDLIGDGAGNSRSSPGFAAPVSPLIAKRLVQLRVLPMASSVAGPALECWCDVFLFFLL
jgi:hypothetical protein